VIYTVPVILSTRGRSRLTTQWLQAGGVAASNTLRALDYYGNTVPASLAPTIHIPLIGSDLTSALILAEGYGTYSATNNGPFTSGDYSESTGLSGVGKSGCYLELNASSPTNAAGSLGMYVRSIGSHASSVHVWGSRNGADGAAVRFRISNALNSFLSQPGTTTTTVHTGFISQSWNGTLVGGSSSLYQSGSLVATVSASPSSGSTTLKAFAEPAVSTSVWQGVCGGLVWWNRELTASEWSQYAAIYQRFQELLGRNV